MKLLIGNRTINVDFEDIKRMEQYVWYCDGRYVYAKTPRKLYLHRFLMDAPTGKQVDHKNGNKLDNRKANLRVCSSKENTRNQTGGKGLSGVKGVYWDKKNKKWIASIMVDYKYKNLGRFSTIEEAARRYNQAAKEYFGEFGKVNIL